MFAETLRLDNDIGGKLAEPAIAGGGVAIATVLIVPGDQAIVERVREAIRMPSPARPASTAWNGFALARFCAKDAAGLAPT